MRGAADKARIKSVSNIWAALERAATITPTKCAFRVLDANLDELDSLSFLELFDHALAEADCLHHEGLAGRRLALLQSTGLDFIISFFGALAAGCPTIPLSARLLLNPPSALENILANASPAALFVDPAGLERALRRKPELEGLLRMRPARHRDSVRSGGWRPPATDHDVTAVIQYTSGSTSSPKGACVSHGNLIANAELLTRTFSATSNEVVVSWLPLFHDMGLMTGVVWPVLAGATSILMSPATFAARPFNWLKALSVHAGSVSSAPNFAFQQCIDRITESEIAELDLASWRVAICGAEPVRMDTVEGFTRRFAAAGFQARSLYPSYGLAESTLFVSGGRRSPRPRSLDLGSSPGGIQTKASIVVSCGEIGDSAEVAIVDPVRRQRLVDGEVGEIWLRGPSVATGYFASPAASQAVFGAVLDHEMDSLVARCWLRTGDLGLVQDGELFVTGRLTDMIIVRGAKYWPQDLEHTARQAHPALADGDGVAFALDEDKGHVAIVHELGRGNRHESRAILAAIRTEVAQIHGLLLFDIVLIDRRTLPRTSSGKVRRAPTRDALAAGALKVLASWRGGAVDMDPAHAAPAQASDINGLNA